MSIKVDGTLVDFISNHVVALPVLGGASIRFRVPVVYRSTTLAAGTHTFSFGLSVDSRNSANSAAVSAATGTWVCSAFFIAEENKV